ncbi:unnamed protein product, partial [Iphiclides podalirius]
MCRPCLYKAWRRLERTVSQRRQQTRGNMSPVTSAFCYIGVIAAVGAIQSTGQEISRQPRLFHLDDYDRCLSKQDGLYCLGTFRLTAESPNSLYEALKNHSGPHSFDRTLLHRGYCVSARCPSSEANATLRFERCVRQRARALSLNSTLSSLKYCRAFGQESAPDDAWPYRAFLAAIGALLLLNFAGTIYDVSAGEKGKNKILTSWSMKANWQKLTASYDSCDPSRSVLSPIRGARVFLLVTVVMSHAIEMTYKSHIANPEFLETAQRHPMSMILRNGSSVVQTFTVISNFLLAFILLRFASKKKLGLSMLPALIMYRVVRISPVHLLVVGFAATWWRLAGDGPLWSALVTAESDICRRKFWSHLLFLNNLIEPQKQCMLQTWFLAVDLQLYIVACFVTLSLVNNLRRAIFVIGGMFIVSCLLNVGLAYVYHWKSLLYLLSPENLRTTFEGVSSFSYFYISPWGSLPACFLGLFAAHLQLYVKEQGYDVTKTKWLVQLYHVSLPLCVAWLLTGYVMTSLTTRGSFAAYIGFERPIISAIAALLLYGAANNLDNCFRRLFSWHGWQLPARLSLSVMMVHRVINMQLVATRTAAVRTSVASIVLDGAVTTFLSYLLAVPLTLLVEMPVQRTFTALFT